LISSSVRRELEARFSGTLLGWAWPLLYPVFMFTVYYFVFTKLLAMRFEELPKHLEAAMGVYMFVGILAWTGFAEGMLRAGGVIVDNGNLIKKLSFPTELLPLNCVLVSTVTMLFGIAVFLLATPLVWIVPGWGLALVPLLLLIQILFAYGLGLFLATMQVFLRDTMQLFGLLTTVWMFITPIFWVPSTRVLKDIGPFLPYLELNPIFHLVYAWRYALMSAQPEIAFEGAPHLWRSIGIVATWALCAFVAGHLFFQRSQRRFADEV
jgi:ABC-type polysaccharide/polyol phosphate export permease